MSFSSSSILPFFVVRRRLNRWYFLNYVLCFHFDYFSAHYIYLHFPPYFYPLLPDNCVCFLLCPGGLFLFRSSHHRKIYLFFKILLSFLCFCPYSRGFLFLAIVSILLGSFSVNPSFVDHFTNAIMFHIVYLPFDTINVYLYRLQSDRHTDCPADTQWKTENRIKILKAIIWQCTDVEYRDLRNNMINKLIIWEYEILRLSFCCLVSNIHLIYKIFDNEKYTA